MSDSSESTGISTHPKLDSDLADSSITRIVEHELGLLAARIKELLAYQDVISGSIQPWEDDDHPLIDIHAVVGDFKRVIEGVLVRLQTMTRAQARSSGSELLAFLDLQFSRTAGLVSRLAELAEEATKRAGNGGRGINFQEAGHSALVSDRLLTSTVSVRADSATHSFVFAQIVAIAAAARCVDEGAFLSAALVMHDLRKDMETEG
jgi:hypothetical protein